MGLYEENYRALFSYNRKWNDVVLVDRKTHYCKNINYSQINVEVYVQ